MSEHRARYKNTALNPSELRRRREEGSIQLRKQKRDDILSNKRRLHQTSPNTDHAEPGIITCDEQLTPKLLEDLKCSQDPEIILESARRVRKCLSNEPDPPFDEVIEHGLIPRLVELLDYHSFPLIQFEVAWILTNISSDFITEHTLAVANSGAIPKLVQLMRTNDPRLQEQGMWALGNIIGDGTKLRDHVIASGFISPLLDMVDVNKDVTFLRNLAWVIVNLYRYNDPPIQLEIARELVPRIKVLLTVNDEKVLIDTTWAISYMIELGPEYFQLILDTDFISRFLPILKSEDLRLLSSTVRALGGMAAGDDEQTQVLINAGILPALSKLLMDRNHKVAKDILWLISNVAAGTTVQVQSIIDAGFVPSIVHYLRVGDFPQQKEATWAIFNLTVTGSEDQLKVLVDEHAVQALCDLLTLTDLMILTKALESLKYLLQKCTDLVVYRIEECGGLDKIESLQNSDSTDVYELSYGILDTFFSSEEA